MSLAAPAKLADAHVLDDFRCSEPELEQWLKQRARSNQLRGASQCFVVCEGNAVVGYYALAAGSVIHADVPSSLRRNMPNPIPVAILGRLAVHHDHAGKGIGSGLLKDALLRASRLSQELGIRALLCHAINDRAKAFYSKHGFIESPLHPMTVMLDLPRLASNI